MTPATPGLHHVTAIAGDPGANAAFYVETLGLRFVKRTVNHDDPGTYHCYFGDGAGTPGTNITFFPWTDRGRRGRFGAGQTRDAAYLIRPDSLGYWRNRLEERGVGVEETTRFGEAVLRFDDPDGIGIELVGSQAAEEADVVPWEDGPVPEVHQLRGFHSVTLGVSAIGPTAGVLTDVLGYEREARDGERGRTLEEASDDAASSEGERGRTLEGASDHAASIESDRHRFRSASGGPGSIVDLVETDAGPGRMGVGAVHHVAFETSDEATQERFRAAFQAHGLDVTEIIDRTYFRSIYAREPGGVHFEVATTGPGFAVDEEGNELGTTLALPPWLEDDREAIEAQLPGFELPEAVGGGPR